MATAGDNSLIRALRILTLCSAAALMPVWTGIAGADDKKEPIAGLDQKAPGAKVTRGEAVQAALKVMPGKVTDVTVERKRGRQVYVIEVVAEKDGGENDILVDMQTAEVLGIEK
jgi:uncharacterized membrane protein YkoI